MIKSFFNHFSFKDQYIFQLNNVSIISMFTRMMHFVKIERVLDIFTLKGISLVQVDPHFMKLINTVGHIFWLHLTILYCTN